MSHPRVIDLDGDSNFRDLGGYETGSGGRVRHGQVYRSGRLSRLSDRDTETLTRLGIRTVVSLLTDDDVLEYGPDRLPPGATSVGLPIDSPTAAALAERARAALGTGDFSTMPPEMSAEIHRLLVAEGASQYGELLGLLADADARPLVFHCSHGVHRTGTGAAILLSLLGVAWPTVRADYLASNVARADEVTIRLSHLRDGVAKRQGVSPEQVDMTNIRAFMVQDGSYIDATRDAVETTFGSFVGYARSALGADDQLLARLRTDLVE